MLIMTEDNYPYIIQDLSAPIVPTHYWTFSAEHQDFMLAQILYLEETTGPIIKIMINKLTFDIPASWNILVVDEETMMIDTVLITDCSTKFYKSFLFSPTDVNLYVDDIKFIDYIQHGSLCHPSISKSSMLCHPVGPNDKKTGVILNCVIGPFDLYKKLQGVSAKELLY